MLYMPVRDMAAWLHDFLPGIAPSMSGDPCWIAFMKTREPEHNPPFYWLGRAFDIASDGDAIEAFRSRLVAAHGADSCFGRGEHDERAQDVLTEACAYAWTVEHLGTPAVEPADERGPGSGAIRLYVPEVETYVAARRVPPQRSMERVLYAVAGLAEDAAKTLPDAASRILYLDLWHERMYAQNVGYRLELTEPIEQALRHFAQEFGMSFVLTRPFQWGNPVHAAY
jgi:hypothetical protein